MARAKAAPAPHLPDSELAELGVTYRSLKATAKKADEDAGEIRGQLLAELAARALTTIEVGAVRITRKVRTGRIVGDGSQAAIEAALAKLPAGIRRLVHKPGIDLTLLEEAAKAGRVPRGLVDELVGTTESAPYIDVTLLER